MSEDKILEKLTKHDEQLDFLAGKSMEHDENFERLEKNINKGFSEVTETLEGIATIVKRLDQERIFTTEWVKRMQNDIDNLKRTSIEHEETLQRVKVNLGIA